MLDRGSRRVVLPGAEESVERAERRACERDASRAVTPATEATAAGWVAELSRTRLWHWATQGGSRRSSCARAIHANNCNQHLPSSSSSPTHTLGFRPSVASGVSANHRSVGCIPAIPPRRGSVAIQHTHTCATCRKPSAPGRSGPSDSCHPSRAAEMVSPPKYQHRHRPNILQRSGSGIRAVSTAAPPPPTSSTSLESRFITLTPPRRVPPPTRHPDQTQCQPLPLSLLSLHQVSLCLPLHAAIQRMCLPSTPPLRLQLRSLSQPILRLWSREPPRDSTTKTKTSLLACSSDSPNADGLVRTPTPPSAAVSFRLRSLPPTLATATTTLPPFLASLYPPSLPAHDTRPATTPLLRPLRATSFRQRSRITSANVRTQTP